MLWRNKHGNTIVLLQRGEGISYLRCGGGGSVKRTLGGSYICTWIWETIWELHEGEEKNGRSHRWRKQYMQRSWGGNKNLTKASGEREWDEEGLGTWADPLWKWKLLGSSLPSNTQGVANTGARRWSRCYRKAARRLDGGYWGLVIFEAWAMTQRFQTQMPSRAKQVKTSEASQVRDQQ